MADQPNQLTKKRKGTQPPRPRAPRRDAAPERIAPIPDTFDNILRAIVTAPPGEVEERLQAEERQRRP